MDAMGIEFSVIFGYVVYIGIPAVAAIGVVIWLLGKIMVKFSYKFPAKKERIEIVHVPFKDQMLKSSQSVTVRFLNRKSKRTYKFVMSPRGLGVGDLGILEYQGRVGLSFTAEGSAIKDKKSIYRNYKFNQEKEDRPEEKERKKRNYW